MSALGLAEDFQHRHMGTVALLQALEPNPLLNDPQRRIAVEFADLAVRLLELVEKDSPMLTDGLRKLWEAKNSVVYASLGRP